jgi:hypothetical protein
MKKVITTAKEMLCFKELEDQTHIPGSTLRRYALKFSQFLPSRTIDRTMRFKPEAVDVFKRIHALYQEGRRTEVIGTILSEELPNIIDVSTVATTVAKADPAVTMVELTKAVNQVAEAMAAHAEIKPMVEKLSLAIEALAKTQAETLEFLRQQQELKRVKTASKKQEIFGLLSRFFRSGRHKE